MRTKASMLHDKPNSERKNLWLMELSIDERIDKGSHIGISKSYLQSWSCIRTVRQAPYDRTFLMWSSPTWCVHHKPKMVTLVQARGETVQDGMGRWSSVRNAVPDRRRSVLHVQVQGCGPEGHSPLACSLCLATSLRPWRLHHLPSSSLPFSLSNPCRDPPHIR